jgi:hypothetical protein
MSHRHSCGVQSSGSSLTYDYIYSTVPNFNLLDYISPVIHHTFITGE